MGNNYYFELVKEKLKYFKTKLDDIDGGLIDIPSDELSALNDVYAIYIYCSADLKTY